MVNVKDLAKTGTYIKNKVAAFRRFTFEVTKEYYQDGVLKRASVMFYFPINKHDDIDKIEQQLKKINEHSKLGWKFVQDDKNPHYIVGGVIK